MKIFVFTFCLYFHFYAFANDSLLAIQYHEKANTSWMNVDTCLKYTLMAIPLLEKTQQWKKYQYNLNALSYCYQKKDDIEKMLQSNLFAYSRSKEFFPPVHHLRLGAANNLGLSLRLKENYNEALKYYFEALEGVNGQDVPLLEGTLLENIGVVFVEKGDYESAIQYLDNSLPILERYFIESLKPLGHLSYQRMAKVHQFRAEAFKELQNYDASRDALNSALEIYNDNAKPLSSFKIDLKIELIDLLLKSNLFLEAKNEISFLKSNFTLSNLQLGNLYFLEGLLGYLKKEYENSVYKFEKSLLKFGPEHLTKKSKSNLYIGLSFNRLQVPIKSNEYLKRSKEILLESPKLTFELDLFDWYAAVIDEYISFPSLGEENIDSVLIDNIQSYIESSRAVISQINSSKSRLDFLSKLKTSNSKILDWLYNNHTLSENQKFLKIAFLVIENSKSILLTSQIKEASYLNGSKEDESISSDINLYKRRIQKINQKRFELSISDSLYDANKKSFEDSIFVYKSKLDIITNQFNERYPERLKSFFKLDVDLEMFEKQLNFEHKTFLNYFEGNDSYYLLVIEDNDAEFIRIDEKNTIQELIKNTLSSLQFNSKQEIVNFTNSSYVLYNRLVGSVDINTSNDLIISPDGALSKLPFSILVKQKEIIHPREINYLIHDFSIAYEYSANAYFNLLNKRKSISSLDFVISKQNGISELKDTLIKTLEHFGLNLRLVNGDSLNSDQFLSLAAKSNVLHISCHANNFDPIYKQPTLQLGNSKLLINDLLQLNLSTELISLSACSTNLGIYYNGEGVNSLASVFIMSGAKSVIGTHWKVNDISTGLIFNKYYNSLLNGNSIDQSLQKAKINYLANCHDNRLAPYYWAGLIPYGNLSTLNREDIYNLPFLSSVIVLVILLGFGLNFFFRKK